MAFSFGFAGDDIDLDVDDSDINNHNQHVALQDTANSLPELVPAYKHDMDDWVSLLEKLIHILFFFFYSLSM